MFHLWSPGAVMYHSQLPPVLPATLLPTMPLAIEPRREIRVFAAVSQPEKLRELVRCFSMAGRGKEGAPALDVGLPDLVETV